MKNQDVALKVKEKGVILKAIKPKKLTLAMLSISLLSAAIIAGCSNTYFLDNTANSRSLSQPSDNNAADNKNTNNINFLAFGDGGYHVDYPKKKHRKP